MRFAVLLAFCLMLSCGARTPLREPDDCPAPFAENVVDFDLADDEVIVAGRAVAALRKSDGSERIIVAEAADRVVTNGREIAWMTSSNADRARLDGGERRSLHKGFGWDETSVDAIAIDAAGNVALTTTSRFPSTELFAADGTSRFVGVHGPPLAVHNGDVFGARGSQLHRRRVGEADATVLLRDLVPDPFERGGWLRLAPDGAVWLRSGRDDVLTRLTDLLPRLDRVAPDGSVATPFRATTEGGLGFDVDDHALIIATNLDRDWAGLRIEELTHAGATVRRLAWCPEYRGTPTVRIDRTHVWVLLRANHKGVGKLYRFPRETS